MRGVIVMIQLEVNQQVARNQQSALAALFISEPETKKRIKKIVREELKDAVKRAREDASFSIKNDPRQAFRAVKFSVYKRIMGGNISILARRRAGARYQYMRPSAAKNPNWRWDRGGNRRRRSSETERLDTYFGADRGFVLRFLNSGAKKGGGDRHIKFTANERRVKDKSNEHPNSGRRGNISPRGWFDEAGAKEMELAAENLSMVIEDELADIYREINKM